MSNFTLRTSEGEHPVTKESAREKTHTHRYTRVAKEARLLDERIARKRAREAGSSAAGLGTDDDDDGDDDDDEERGRWGGGGGGGAGVYSGEGADAYARLEELLKAAQVCVHACACVCMYACGGVLFLICIDRATYVTGQPMKICQPFIGGQ